MSFQIIPARKIMMASALIKCMILMLILSGRRRSFFLKKYINKYRDNYALPRKATYIH